MKTTNFMISSTLNRMLRHARNYISPFKNGNQMYQYEGPEPWISKIEDEKWKA